MRTFISLGAGVQSSTMALMAACGAITPMPLGAIFSDTGDEPESVYTWLDWLEKQLPFPVYRVSVGPKLSDVATEVKLSKKSGNTYVKIGIPAYMVGKDGLRAGIGMRQCTRTFKIEPIRRKLRSLSCGEQIDQWIGISYDELIRVKPSQIPWIVNRWPLVDLKMTRADCIQWMGDHGMPRPPRSACVYCPYHNNVEWQRLKTEEPAEFQKAVDFEKRLQEAYTKSTAMRAIPYLHSSRIPLSEVVFDDKLRRLLRKEPELFGNECEGMCGV